MTIKTACFFALLMIIPVLAFASGDDPGAGERAALSKQTLSTERDLETRFGVNIDQTLQNRGGRTIFQRDRVGDGTVGVFYDYTYDDRIQDGSDAIGVQVRLLRL